VILRAMVCLLMAIVLSGCFPWKDKADRKAPDEIRLTPETIVLWEAGQSMQLQASLVDGDGKPYSAQPGFAWQVDKSAIVHIDQTGLVVAKGEGEARISVMANGLQKIARVIVTRDAPLLQGRIFYHDRLQNRRGFTGELQSKPVRYAMVDLIDSRGSVVQSTWTDATGRYQFAIISPGPFSLRVVAISRASVGGEINVANLSGQVYAVKKALNGDYTADQNVTIEYSSQLAGVFNILDVMTAGGQFVRAHSRVNLPPLNVYWQTGNQNGTYYCSGPNAVYCAQGNGIYIFNQGAAGDTDEFDDDVLWHEYSHYLAHNVSRDDSPGGCHVLSANDLDLRLAWSEGWGDFFPAAIKHWLLAQTSELSQLVSVSSETSPSLYLDTSGMVAQISIDIANPGGRPFVYAANELAVSKVLWGMMTQFGMSFIWQVFEHGLPAAGRQVNLETFWQSMFTQHGITDFQRGLLDSIMSDREIDYRHDSYEPDNSQAGELQHNVAQSRYLYDNAFNLDEDRAFFIASSGESWELETFWLTNGADTVIDVLDPAGRLIASNNDVQGSEYYRYDYVCGGQRVRNDDSALASKVVVNTNIDGKYEVRVRSHASRSAAGRYGSYTLRARRQ